MDKEIDVYDHMGGTVKIKVDLLSELLYKLRPRRIDETTAERVAAVETAYQAITELIDNARKEELEHLGIEKFMVQCGCHAHIMHRSDDKKVQPIEDRIAELSTNKGDDR